MKRSMFIALFLVLAAVAAFAAPTEPTEPGAPVPTTRSMTRGGFGGASETTITGLVTTRGGEPIDGVTVKLYIGGLLVNEAAVQPDGSFEMNELIDYGRDVTIDLWFVPEDASLVMENVLLKESSAAAGHRLYSPCIPRVRLDPITDVIITMYDIDGRNEMLTRKNCAG